MSRLFLFIVALGALSAPALGDTRPVLNAPQPTGLAGKFIASGGTIARNTNTTQLPIGNPLARPLCGTVTKDNPNVPVPCR